MRFSWEAQLSTMYLYSTSPAGMQTEMLYTPSWSSSLSVFQDSAPHQPHQGPVTCTVEKVSPLQDMSTLNVVGVVRQLPSQSKLAAA